MFAGRIHAEAVDRTCYFFRPEFEFFTSVKLQIEMFHLLLGVFVLLGFTRNVYMQKHINFFIRLFI